MRNTSKNILLTPKQMNKADELAVASGVPSIDLMENAGQGVVDVVLEHYSPCSVLILCGAGNNGGDGFVVARLLAEKGIGVELVLLDDVAKLKGDAKINANRYQGEIKSFKHDMLGKADLIIDAIFGSGLDRDVMGEFASIIEQVNKSKIPIIAVDVPSGIDGASGEVRGIAIKATHSVSFFRAKPAHYLLPGREYCGQLHIKDIGIPKSMLQNIEANCWLNQPNLWQLPNRKLSSHKYDAGHCVVLSGDELHSGAARLAARAALRIGAGLVTLVGKKPALLIHASHLSSIMLKEINNAHELSQLLLDKRYNCVIIGPALGVAKETAELVLVALQSSVSLVVDADGLSSFLDNPEILFAAIKQRQTISVVLTPHEGEFKRLFPKITGSKIERAKQAAKISGSIVVLKGADSVICAPDGSSVINNNAPPELATAGSGDVLSGIIAALMAQGMKAHKAASAGVYLHAMAGLEFGGAGLIADDLPDLLPKVIKNLG
ncbi:MAG: NAD(P)H-hydrate dehydratase [Devosiaceae bacterium]|nr:NAD(P)H-hydrate dehydratase [Devosiaceae bacterium]